MIILQYILVAVEVVSCSLLILLILMQKPKDQGLGLAFGSGMGEALFGSRAGNILTKLTVIFAAVFLINTLLLSLMYSGQRGQSLMGRYGRVMEQQQPRPVRQGPAAPGSAPAAPVAGAPTLPGTDFGGEGQSMPAAPAAPAEQPAPSAKP
jgi:preprotein translocase subunit SecG